MGIDYIVHTPRTQKGRPIPKPVIVTFDYKGNVLSVFGDRDEIEREKKLLEQADRE